MDNLALKLNGTTSYAEIPNFNLISNYTIEFAIKPYKLEGIIINNKNSFAVGFYNNNSFILSSVNSKGSEIKNIKLNEWNYISIVYDENNIGTVFINGNKENSIINSYWTDSGNYIGKRNNGTFYNGEIDEIRIWNKIIAQDKMLSFSQKQIKNTENELIAHYTFDNNIPNKIINVVGATETNSYNCEYTDGANIEYFKLLIKQNNQYYSIKSNFQPLGQPSDNIQLEEWYNKYGVDDINIIVQDINSKEMPMSLDSTSGIWTTDKPIDFNDVRNTIELVDIDENNKNIKYECEKYRIIDLCEDEFEVKMMKEK